MRRIRPKVIKPYGTIPKPCWQYVAITECIGVAGHGANSAVDADISEQPETIFVLTTKCAIIATSLLRVEMTLYE